MVKERQPRIDKQSPLPEQGDRVLPITELDLYRKGFTSIYITLTHWCNLTCPHCYDQFLPRSGMTPEQCQYIIGQVEGLNLPSYFYDLSGGELMGIRQWPRLLELFLATGKEVAVNTNGTLINEKSVMVLKALEMKYPGRLFLSVSLDSHDPDVNAASRPGAASNKVFRGMELLKENGIRFRAAITLTSKNIDSIEDTVRFIVNNYSRELIVGVIRPVFEMQGEGADILVSYKDALDTMMRVVNLKNELGDFEFYHCFNAQGETFCEAGRDRISIFPDGNITSCYTLQTPDQYVGNIYKEPLIDIVRRMHEIHEARDNRYLLCELRHGSWGEPTHYLGKKP